MPAALISSVVRDPQAAHRLHHVGELRLADLEVSAHDGGDQASVAGDEEGRLGGAIGADPEQRGQGGDGVRLGRRHLFGGELLLRRGLGHVDARNLLVRRIVAGVTQHQRVLAVLVEDHELVGQAATHDAHIRPNHDGGQAQPVEDAGVGRVVGQVGGVQPGLVGVERVRILHHELAHADQAAARSRLVTELGLEVVDDGRQLPVALDQVAQQVGNDLLVGHGQHHVPATAVLETDQLGADLGVAAGLLPELGGVDDRHLHLLAADPVDLLADHLLDALLHAEAQRQERVDAGPQLPHVAGAHEQPVADHLGLGRIVAEAGEEEV